MATNEKPSRLRVGDIAPLSKRMLAPIEGYEQLPLVSIEEAVQPLIEIVPKVERNAILVKRNCNEPKDGLTSDESAAIMLYTFESVPRAHSLYVILNDTLRSENRQKLTPWFLYLRLILNGLAKIPSKTCHVYRGVRQDLRKEYPRKSSFIWWSFSSCTRSIEILENEQFFGQTGARTLFEIDCFTGKDIKSHSFIPHEDEVLLMPAREFYVKSILNSGNDLHIIQLEEVEAKITIIAIPFVKQTEVLQNDSNMGTSDIPLNAKWKINATTIITDLGNPEGICINPTNRTLFIADSRNNRIVAWTLDKRKLQVVAGGHDSGNGLHQLNKPTDVFYDQNSNVLFICDSGNRRVMRWPLGHSKTIGEVIISDIDCWGITMDNQGELYVTDVGKHEVRKYTKSIGNTSSVVAGGHGKGEGLHQLHRPYFVAVDNQGGVYVSDCWNHRIVKWPQKARQGSVVIGGQTSGVKNTQLSYPRKIFLDTKGTLYVAEQQNHRITRWRKGEKRSDTIAGGTERGSESDQLHNPTAFCFDNIGDLYVVDTNNHRIQCFSIE